MILRIVNKRTESKKCICGHFELDHILKKAESVKSQLSNHSRPPGELPKLFDNIVDKFSDGKLVCEKCDCESFKKDDSK